MGPTQTGKRPIRPRTHNWRTEKVAYHPHKGSTEANQGWMSAGKEIPAGTDVAEAMRLGGLDYQVALTEKAPSIEVDGVQLQDANARLIYRTDTMRAFTTVSTSFYPIQNEVSFKVLDELHKRGVVKEIVACGTLKGGASAWILASLGDRAVQRLDGDFDPINATLCFRNAHDKTSSFVAGIAPNRICCSNALASLFSGLALEVRIQHRSGAEEKLAQAIERMLGLVNEYDEYFQLLQQLERSQMNRESFVYFAHDLLNDVRGPIRTDDADEARVKARRKAREDEIATLLDYFENGVGNHGETRYDAFNAVTEYVTHQRQRLTKSAWGQKQLENRFANVVFGQGRSINTAALRRLAS